MTHSRPTMPNYGCPLRLISLVLFAATGLLRAPAQQPPPPAGQTQVGPSQPLNQDALKREVEELEKSLAAVKTRLAALAAASPSPASAPLPAPVPGSALQARTPVAAKPLDSPPAAAPARPAPQNTAGLKRSRART